MRLQVVLALRRRQRRLRLGVRQHLAERLHVVKHRVHVGAKTVIRPHRGRHFAHAVADRILGQEVQHAVNLFKAHTIVARIGNLILQVDLNIANDAVAPGLGALRRCNARGV